MWQFDHVCLRCVIRQFWNLTLAGLLQNNFHWQFDNVMKVVGLNIPNKNCWQFYNWVLIVTSWLTCCPCPWKKLINGPPVASWACSNGESDCTTSIASALSEALDLWILVKLAFMRPSLFRWVAIAQEHLITGTHRMFSNWTPMVGVDWMPMDKYMQWFFASELIKQNQTLLANWPTFLRFLGGRSSHFLSASPLFDVTRMKKWNQIWW